MKPKAAVSWSGGKDSCAALHRVRNDYEIVAAVTMFTEDGSRSRSHGLRPEVIAAQLERMGLQSIMERCTWSTYDRAFEEALAQAAVLGVTHVIFGDILFDEHREWAEARCAAHGLTAVEPLWRIPTSQLYREFLQLGGRARIVTVRSSELDESYLGRELVPEMLDDLTALGVDPCGENGEYHTVVVDCPAFSRPLSVRPGARAVNSGCIAEDLLLDD